MPKTVIVRAHSSDAHKASGAPPDITVQAKFPTLDEVVANPALKVSAEAGLHANYRIGLQSKLRQNHNLVDKTKVLDPQKVADSVDYSTMGTRQRGGLTPNKIQAALGELAAGGDIAKLTQAINLNKAGNLVELEKFLRANCPKTFAKAAPKAKAVEAKK